MSQQNTPTRLFSQSGFSFGKILTPKLRKLIDFDAQPTQSQNGSPTAKKSGLEAYAKKNKLSLPPDFSDTVLECEMELEKDEVSIEAITKLTDLYSQAMAFYEAEGSHKYKYFAKKLQDLMLKPNVKETMVREIAPVKNAAEDKELKRMRLESQVSKVNTEKEAFTLVKTHEHKEKQIKRVLDGDLNSQRDRIQKKLAERKAKSQSRAQSVNYISDEASSTTEEAQMELDKDSSPRAEKLIKIEEADEADESRYGTPPRRRNKDGQMIIYFPKGKKSLKKLFLEELKESAAEAKKVVRGHARRNSENKPPVLNTVTAIAKRVGRAQSFSSRNLVPSAGLLDKARKISSNSLENKDGEESKTESHDQDARSLLSDMNKNEHVENAPMVEKKEEEKPKSNNTVEETDEEGSKNDGSGSKSSLAREEEEISGEKVEETKQGSLQDELVVEEKGEEVADVEEKHIAGESVVINDEVHEQKEEVHEEVTKEEEAVKEEVLVEKEAEASVEEKQAEDEPVQENNEVQAVEVAETVAVKEEVIEEKEIVKEEENSSEVKEHAVQEEKGNETEVVAEQKEEKELESESAQGNNDAQAVEAASEIIQEVQEKVSKIEEVVEDNKEPEPVTEAEEQVQNETEATVEETNKIQEAQTEEKQAVEEVEQKEESKTETENIAQAAVEVEKEDAAAIARRRRTDSEIADEEKLKMLRQLDEENKILLEEFINKQAQAREDAVKQVEEKFAKKLQAMEEDMEPEEKLSMMWQKAIAKINKDKETEIQKVLEGLTQEHSQEVEKYKKKLQQQKMFKLAELSS